MFILFESSEGPVCESEFCEMDPMGAVETEQEAIEWRDENQEYRDYKYVAGIRKAV